MKLKLKCIISLLLIVMLITACAPLTALAEDSDTPKISINKLYLKAGEAIKVNNPENYDLKYYVGDTEIEDGILKTDYYEKWITVKAYNGEDLAAEDKAYFSKLPVIYINTEDGKKITSKTEYKTADMSIQNNEISNKEIYNGTIDIRGRGNTSWKIYPKKPYKIKLNKKTDLFGMGKNKHWVLLANYLDNCCLRNVTASGIAHELGVDAMDFVWTDLVLNGEYVGNYLLGEQVRIDKTRVDIFDWEDEAEELASAVSKAENKNGVELDTAALEDALKQDLSWVTSGKFKFRNKWYLTSDYYNCEKDISGGYLFEMSEEYDEVSKFTTDGGLKVMLKSPEFLNTNPDMTAYAQDYWNNFEKAYKSETGYVKINGENTHYTELADLDSMVGFWLVNEIMGNNDAVSKSRYVYKDIGEKLKFGPVWDFDFGCGASPIGNYPTGWKISRIISEDKVDANFYKELLDDPLFIAKAVEKYWQVRPYLQTLIEDGGTIDTEIEYLRESGIVDNNLWDRHEVYPKTGRNFEEDSAIFKDYMTKRIAWLDNQFTSENKLITSTRTSASSYPYTNSSNKIKATLSDVEEDSSETARADGKIGSDKDLSLKANVTDELTTELKVYVNGIYTSSVEVKEGAADVTIPKRAFTMPYDTKNVISFIGKNKDGETTYKTFKTVKTYYVEDESGLNNTDYFMPDKEDGNIGKFGLNVNSFKNYELLGLQLKPAGNSSVRFVTAAKSDILKDADDYGFVFSSEDTDKDIDDIRINAEKYFNDGEFVSCKGTSNTVSMGDYGNGVLEESTEGYTKYKYITASLENIPDDKFVIAAFCIKKSDKTYYALYKATKQACVFKISDLRK